MANTLSQVKCVLVDISGTLQVEGGLTLNANISINQLRKAGLQLRFVTNVTDETRSEITAKLHSIGVQAAEAEVYTSLQAAKVVVQDNSYEPYCLLPYKAQQEVYSGLSPDQPNSVIIGYSPEHLNYRHMNEAFRILYKKEAKLIAVHKAAYFKVPKGVMLGPGPFIEALESATGKKALFVGKPEPTFFCSVIKDLNSNAMETVMIGDDVVGDIIGAHRAGLQGILVKTGAYSNGDEKYLDGRESTFLAENFAHAAELILTAKK